MTVFLGLLAECELEAGRADEALVVVDEGLACAAREGERLYEAELMRIRGEALLARKPADRLRARENFVKAIDVARLQGAKALELRAEASLETCIANEPTALRSRKSSRARERRR